jgi:2-polyprenyl-3-methyl-5-hydroxy-6-metoxy-1,4-benzoquinol methylase
MASDRPSGTEGYAEEAEVLIRQYEAVSFQDVHRQVLHLMPSVPGRILDVGSGTGRDAAAFAAMGHHVVAVEPTAELRLRAMSLHPSPSIDWLDDCLPDLSHLGEQVFDVVMLTAVWMHLDEPQRRLAMPRIAGLIRQPGVIILSLRHGPVPIGRRMFEVTAAETIHLGRKDGLSPVLTLDGQDGVLRRPGVSWTRLAFARR